MSLESLIRQRADTGHRIDLCLYRLNDGRFHAILKDHATGDFHQDFGQDPIAMLTAVLQGEGRPSPFQGADSLVRTAPPDDDMIG